MKMIKLLTIAILLVLYSCSSGEKGNAPKVEFGIYETIRVNDLPAELIDKAKKSDMEMEKDSQLPIIGYIMKDQSIDKQSDFEKGGITFIKTHKPVDKEGKYFALVAIQDNPVINIGDIQKTKSRGRKIEIYFNMEGSKKWAEMTKNNKGSMVAFVIDNEIYSMPYINGEIINGTALITGLESEAIAEKLSISLNTGKSD